MLIALTLFGCANVDAGTVVLQVWQTAPDESQRYAVLRGGRYYDGPNTDYIVVPTTEQSANFDDLKFAGKDGQTVTVDISAIWQIADSDAEIIKVVKTYTTDLNVPISRIGKAIRNELNTCAADYTVEQLYSDGKAPLAACVESNVAAAFEPNGIRVSQVNFGQIDLPAAVAASLEASIAASQEADRTRREVEQTKAEGEKTVAKATADAEALRVRTEAEAQANERISASITPSIITLRRLEVQAAYAEKWDGKLPVTQLGGDVPLIMDLD